MNNYSYYQSFYRVYPDKLNPYKVLGLNNSSSKNDVKNAYFRYATNQDRNTRCRACLAYDIIVNPNKYEKIGNEYKPKCKDCFYDVVVGDLDSLKTKIKNNKNLIFQTDELNRTLLYLAARNGYFDITKFLIEKGSELNHIQNSGSTPLHGASFYGQELVVQLLLEYGAIPNIRNTFGNTPADEARTESIRNNITNSQRDQINILFQKLLANRLATNLIPIQRKNKVVAYKILCTSASSANKSWVPCWHEQSINIWNLL